MRIQMERFECINSEGKRTGVYMKPGEVHEVEEAYGKRLVQMGVSTEVIPAAEAATSVEKAS